MSEVAVIVPSIREHRRKDLEKNIKDTCSEASVYFYGKEYPSYAKAANAGVKETTEPFIFVANDDFVFHPNWYEKAKEKMSDKVKVVGMNDGSPEPSYTTIFLVKRKYIDEEGGTFDKGPGVMFSEDYNHFYTDTEFCELARIRNVMDISPESLVEHLHPAFNKGIPGENYAKPGMERDSQIFMERRRQYLG